MWSYAVVAGLSAPVVRAALMMSFAQLALGTSQRGNGYNLVLGAATLMLAIHPGYLYDVSFQLSFVAVLSILFSTRGFTAIANAWVKSRTAS